MTSTVDWDAAEAEAEFSEQRIGSSGTSRTTTGRTTRGRRVSDKRLGSLKDKLSGEMFGAGAMIGLGAPVTGYYICQESDHFCEAVVSLASRKTEWVAALENVALLGPGITVGRTVLGIGAALASDRFYRTGGESGLNPEKTAAVFLGVTTAYLAVHPPEGGGKNTSENSYSPPPYTGFTPVS